MELQTDETMEAANVTNSAPALERPAPPPGFPPGPPRDDMKDPKKLAWLHKGACSSPRANTCPCPKKCPLHGRCCDCIRNHMGAYEENGAKPGDTSWFPECFKLAMQGRFDGLHD